MIISLLFLYTMSAQAWETDNFSCHAKDLKDSSAIFDAEINRRLDQGVKFQEKAAPGVTTCNWHILNDFHALLANPFFGNLETWADSNNGIDKCKIRPEDSIYGKIFQPVPNSDWDLSLASTGSGVQTAGLSSVVNIGGIYLGLDKLAHFMTEGELLEMKNGRGGDTAVLKRFVIPEEEGGYGLRMSGVYSYADLMAGWTGMQFWKKLIGSDDPFLKCVNGQWRRVRDFHFKEFLNAGVDESVNCNRYRTKSMQIQADNYIEKLEKKSGKSLKCSSKSVLCQSVAKSFQKKELAELVLNPSCITTEDASAATQNPGAGVLK